MTPQKLAVAMRDHLAEQLGENLNPTLTVERTAWVDLILKEVPHDGVAEAPTIASDALDEFLESSGYERHAEVWRHAERHAAQQAAEIEAAAKKRAAEEAPLRNILREVIIEVLLEAGLAKPKGIVPAHPTKKGPGRKGAH